MKYSESLKKNQDFKVVYQNGTSYANRLLVMYVLKNQHMKNRLGISVSKKVGNSVVRHRLTRLIRESYRLNETDFDSNLDIVVVARASAKGKGFHEIESAFMHLAKKHHITGNEHDKEISDYDDKTLSKIYIADVENEMSLYSHMFSIWFGSNRKIWRIQGQSSCGMEDPAMQSFFPWRL